MELIKYLSSEKIFFLKRFNILYCSVCIVLFAVESLFDFLIDSKFKVDINIFLIQNHLGPLAFALGILFLYSFSQEFRVKKIHNFIGNGFTTNDIYIFKLVNSFYISLVSGISYLFMNLLLTSLQCHALCFSFSFPAFYTYLLLSLFFTSFFFLLFVVTRNSLFAILLFILIAATEQFLKKLFFGMNTIFLPVSSAVDVLNNVEINPWVVFYIFLFLISSYFGLRSVKNWDRY